MSSIPSSFSRTSTQLTSNQLLTQLHRIQKDLAEAQISISTGKQVNKPSDAPAKTSAILLLRSQLDARSQHERNLNHIASMLNNVDQALADSNNILIEAKSIGLSQIGIGSDEATRQAEASVIDAQLAALIEISNRRVQDINLFSGSANAAGDGNPFVEFLGGVRYTGSTTNLIADTGLRDPLAYNINGAEAFGALSRRVTSLVDLDPQATASTRLSEVNGVVNSGVQPGSVIVTIDGQEVTVDLTKADTLGDVVTRIQDAIDTVDPTAGSLSVNDPGFQLTAAAGHTITISDIGRGQTALDLGINITATGASTQGGDLNARVTQLTSLADLNATIDFASGLKITQGAVTKTADFSNAQNVQDLQNVIDSLAMGLRLEINEDGSGLNLITDVSGLELSVGEVAGGTTATDLGLRTFDLSTELSEFNFGNGVERIAGEDDFQIQLHDGSTVAVNLDDAVTVQDVVNAIQTAATNAGVTVGALGQGGTSFNVGLATDGNGLVFEDNTAGASDFTISVLNDSRAAFDLGIRTNVGSGNTIEGEDNVKVRVENLFTNLINLRDSLKANDSSGISLATDLLDDDIEQLIRVRAEVGVRTQRAEQSLERSEELAVSEQILLSDLEEGDLTELITRFTQMQQQFQVSLQVGAQNLQLSLLDFLR